MIDFVNLVDSLLEEQKDGYSFLIVEAAKKDDIFNNHFQDTRYNDAKAALTSKYGVGITIPSRNDLKTVIVTLANTTIRGGINPTTIPNIAEWFPLFDLLCLFNTQYSSWSATSTSTPTPSAAGSQITYNDWKSHLASDRSTVPMEYAPLDAEAKIAKSKLLKDTNLGKLRLETISDNHSFFASSSYLIDIRRTIHDKTWPKFVTKLFDTDGRKVISNILYNPKSIIGGTYKVDKKLEAIFDQGIIRNLVGISLSFYGMFRKELNTVVDIFINQINPTAADSATFEIWKDKLTASKVETINTLTTNNELYKQYIGDPSKTQAMEVDFLPFIVDGFAAAGIPNSASYSILPGTTAAALSSLDPKPYFKQDVNPQTFTFKYDFANLKNAARGDYPEAKALYQEFESMADYLQTKETRDIRGGLVQLAKAATLGVKNVGT